MIGNTKRFTFFNVPLQCNGFEFIDCTMHSCTERNVQRSYLLSTVCRFANQKHAANLM